MRLHWQTKSCGGRYGWACECNNASQYRCHKRSTTSVSAGEAAEATESVAEMNAALARLEELEQTITAKDRKQPTEWN